jgi:signal transduction histidine kinase
LSTETEFPPPVIRLARIPLIAVYFFYFTVVLRTLALEVIRPRLPVYLALEFLYVVLFTLVLRRPIRRRVWQHLYFVFQSMLVLGLLALRIEFDFIVVLFVLLSFQAALVFPGRARWAWVAVLLVLTALPLTILLGGNGLAVALLPMTVGIVFPAYVTITLEIEAGQRKQKTLLAELQETNRNLTAYAGQIEELSAIQERSRLARELHDSVSQTMFSISLHSRAARILLERDPDRLRPQLEKLQTLTQDSLKEMRSLIADLRPQENGIGDRPTS